MPHSSVHLLSSLHESPGGTLVAALPFPGVRALLSYLTAGAQRTYGREMLAGSPWPDRDVRTILLAALPNPCQALGGSTATSSPFHLNPDALQFNVSGDNWSYLSRGIAYARS